MLFHNDITKKEYVDKKINVYQKTCMCGGNVNQQQNALSD